MIRKFPIVFFVSIAITGILAFKLVPNGIHNAIAAPAHEDQIQPGLDLIVLLDHSSSMCGFNCGIPYKPTDPDNRRVYTTQYLIDYLAFDNKFINEQRRNRVVVIGFGMHATIQVPLTALWDQNAVDAAKQGVKPENLDATNFVEALAKVRQVFSEQDDQNEVESGIRQRLIVIITDGGPDLGDGRGPVELFKEIQDAYFKTYNLATYYPLYVITIDDANRYDPIVSPFWKEFVADYKKVDDVNQVNQYVAEKLCAYLNPSGSKTNCDIGSLGWHFIQPYAKSVAFSFFKYTTNENITLKRADGSSVKLDPADPDVIKHSFTPRDEMVVLAYPQAGCWYSEGGTEGKVDIIVQVAFNDLKLVEPATAHPIVTPLKMVFELRDESGNLVDEDPNFPITIQGTLTGPDGKQQSIDLQRELDDDGQPAIGRYVSEGIPTIGQLGEYTLSLKGYTNPRNLGKLPCLTSTEPIRVFENPYTIPVVAPSFQVKDPQQPFFQYYPVRGITVNYLDSNNQPILIPDDTPWKLDLEAISPSGVKTPLPSPKLSQGAYTISDPVIFPETGTYTLVGTLRNPATGTVLYTAQTSFETAVNPRVIQPLTHYPAFSPLTEIQIQLADKSGNPVSPEANYPLSLEVELFWPNNSTQLGPVALFPMNEAGKYGGHVNWMLVDEGNYTLQVRGFFLLPSGEKTLAFDYPAPLRISSNLPYFNVVSPENGKPIAQNTHSLHKGLLPIDNPMKFRVEVWRGDHAILVKDAFTSDVNAIAFMQVLGPGNHPVITQTLPLAEDGTSLEFETLVLTERGTYTATFHFQGDVVGGVPTKDLWPDVEVIFARRDPGWVLWVWGGSIVLIIAVILAAAIWIGLEFFILPKVGGALVAERIGVGGKEIQSFPLTRFRRHTVVIRERSMGGLKLKRLKILGVENVVINKGKQDEEKKIGVSIEAIGIDGKPAARGAVKSHQRPRGTHEIKITCAQKDAEGKSYQFKLKL